MSDNRTTEAERRKRETIQKLKEALKRNKLIIVVGAGVTLAATATPDGPIPRVTWPGLIRNGLDYLIEETDLDASSRQMNRANEDLNEGDLDSLLSAATYMTSQMRRTGKLPTWLDSVFGSLHQEIKHPLILETMHQLQQQGAILLTTNYDDLLEHACKLPRIGRSDHNTLLRFRTGESKGILHVHGSYHDPDEVVLDSVDYYKVTQSEEIQNMLQTYLDWNTILFIGCGSGLEDPNFGALLKWAGDRQDKIANRHCLLVRDGDSLSHRYLLRLKYGPQYQDLAPFLRQLLDQTLITDDNGNSNAEDQPRTTISLQRNPDFVGRLSVFEKLDRQFGSHGQSPKKAALCGLGGVGERRRKSQIALEYAHRFKSHMPCSTFWVHANTSSQFEESFQLIARKCNVFGHKDPNADQLQLVQDWLEKKHNIPWLMVIDNVDDMEIITRKRENQKRLLEYIPSSTQGHVVFTTRDRDTGINLADHPIDISLMNTEEAQKLLRNKMQPNPSVAEELELLGEIGFLPLAITQAVAYMKKRRLSVSQYLTLFRQSDRNKLALISHKFCDHGRDSRPMDSLANTWMVSFNYIQSQNPRASELLVLMSLLDKNAIPNSLLINDNEGDLEFLDAMSMLESFALVNRKIESDHYSIHRLVQLATRVWIREEDQMDRSLLAALCILSERFPNADYENWSTCSDYLPHADTILNINFQSETEEAMKAKAVLLYKLSKYLLDQGDYLKSVDRAQKAVELRRRTLGFSHQLTLQGMAQWALALTYRNDLGAAEELVRETLAIQESHLGPNHDDTCVSFEILAQVLDERSEFEAAEQISAKAIAGRKTTLGHEHPLTLSILSYNGMIMGHLRKFKSAQVLLTKVADSQRMVRGEKHLDTLQTMCRLAVVEQDLGHLKTAEDLLQLVIANAIQSIGQQHPEFYVFIHCLAVIFSTQRKHNEAANLNRRCLKWRETVLGKWHLDTLNTMENLAMNLSWQEKHAEAETLVNQAIQGRRNTLGENHVETITAKLLLVDMLCSQQSYARAEQLCLEVVEASQRALGQHHRTTLDAKTRLGITLYKQAKYEESLVLCQATLMQQERDFGNFDSDVLTTKSNIARVLEAQARYGEAEALYREVLQGQVETFGERHPETIVCRSDIACVLTKQLNFTEAEMLYRQTLQERIEEMGENHSETIINMELLADTLIKQAKVEEAKALYLRTIRGLTEELGESHPETLKCRLKLARSLFEQHRYSDARTICEQTLQASIEVLGSKHVSTLGCQMLLVCILCGQSKFAEAEDLCQQTLSDQIETLGNMHLDTIKSFENLAVVLENQDKFEAALGARQAVLDRRLEVFGNDHLETQLARVQLAVAFGKLRAQ